MIIRDSKSHYGLMHQVLAMDDPDPEQIEKILATASGTDFFQKNSSGRSPCRVAFRQFLVTGNPAILMLFFKHYKKLPINDLVDIVNYLLKVKHCFGTELNGIVMLLVNQASKPEVKKCLDLVIDILPGFPSLHFKYRLASDGVIENIAYCALALDPPNFKLLDYLIKYHPSTFKPKDKSLKDPIEFALEKDSLSKKYVLTRYALLHHCDFFYSFLNEDNKATFVRYRNILLVNDNAMEVALNLLNGKCSRADTCKALEEFALLLPAQPAQSFSHSTNLIVNLRQQIKPEEAMEQYLKKSCKGCESHVLSEVMLYLNKCFSRYSDFKSVTRLFAQRAEIRLRFINFCAKFFAEHTNIPMPGIIRNEIPLVVVEVNRAEAKADIQLPVVNKLKPKPEPETPAARCSIM